MSDESTAVTILLKGENSDDSGPTQVSRETIQSAGPTMPRLSLNVELDPGFSVLQIDYEITVSYQGHGRNDTASFNGSGPNDVIIDWGSTVHGGEFAGRVNIEIRRPNGSTYWHGWTAIPEQITIVGENPSQAGVIAACGSKPPAVIAQKTSSMAMFDNGMPHHDGGFGLFELASASPAEIWNWRTNVATGVAEYHRRVDATRTYPQSLRDADSKYEGLPDYTEEQLKTETYQSYSEGRYYEPVKRGIIFRRWRWRKSKEVNGFADECLAIEATMP